MSGNTICAFYDLAVNRASYDILKFVTMADSVRHQLGLRKFHAYIVPSDEITLSIEQISKENWVKYHLLLPALTLSPNCSGVSVLATREEAKAVRGPAQVIFPENYSVENPIPCFADQDWIDQSLDGLFMPSLFPISKALDYVNAWSKSHCHEKPIISITVRENSSDEESNSSIPDWVEFAHTVQTEGYAPVFLRDSKTLHRIPGSEFTDILLFDEAAFNLELRAAFYNICHVNMFVSDGPSGLCIFNIKTPYVIFMKNPNDLMFVGEQRILQNGNFPWAGRHQCLAWETDSFKNIDKQFSKLNQLLLDEKDSIEDFKNQKGFLPIG